MTAATRRIPAPIKSILGIDRRFYRRKYDAAKILAGFGESMRNEVDANRLSDAILAVVQETMQPMHTSLWLRPAHNGVKVNRNDND